jgi:ribose/xylose/arabinose/galactoside ABC-type transport system permease subunit/ABC-type Na+ transport system ATPase subunit NatA
VLRVGSTRVYAYGDAYRAGAVFVGSDRMSESLYPSLAVRDNLSARVLDRVSRLGVIRHSAERKMAEAEVERFGIRLQSVDQPVSSLSGGNQQKVALSKSLATRPVILLVDEPTQGVDVRSRADIYRMLRSAANESQGVVICSSEASELVGLCDRIVVVSRGAVVAELAGEGATEEEIVAAFTTVDDRRESGAATTDRAGPVKAPARAGRFARLRRWAALHQGSLRAAVLVVLLVAIGAYAQAANSTFDTTASLYNILLVAAPLAYASVAEFLVVLVGGIDVSVGGVMALTVVVISFLAQNGSAVWLLPIMLLVAIGIGGLAGAGNATLIEGAMLSPVIATIATLSVFTGLALTLRPTAAGSLSLSLTQALTRQAWIFTAPLLVLIGLLVVGDFLLRRTGTGLTVRAVGLQPLFSSRLGIPVRTVRFLAYVTGGAVAGIAGLALAAQVGTGDSTVGSGFVILAIAAPVLGGASLAGGRGSFIGCLLGAVLLALLESLSTILSITNAANYLLTGGLLILGLMAYSNAGTELRNATRGLGRRLAARLTGIGR